MRNNPIIVQKYGGACLERPRVPAAGCSFTKVAYGPERSGGHPAAARPVNWAATLQRFGDIGPTPAMGQGLDWVSRCALKRGQNPLPGSTGSFYWTGAYGTTFFIDPKQQLIIIMMIQVPLPAGPFYRHEVRYLAIGLVIEAIRKIESVVMAIFCSRQRGARQRLGALVCFIVASRFFRNAAKGFYQGPTTSCK
jgi:hypothetical protein